MSIGFFDSGIGGLTVLKQALEAMPGENFIYYADTDNVPYGPKTKEEVRRFVAEAVEMIAGKGVDALVIACNTATSVVIEDLRRRYEIPIIGMEPAVKPAVEITGGRHKRVLVFATKLTLTEEKFKNLVERIDDEKIIDSHPMPGLVTFAEKGQFDEETVLAYLREELKDFELSDYGTVVLGCTHFVYFKDIVRKLMPSDVQIIDGNEGTIRHLIRILGKEKRKAAFEKAAVKTGLVDRVSFFESGREVEDSGALKRYEDLMGQVPS
ncbi:MAG: glutamate racemase [Clostridiales bacterium]|nr:glutamate racemase [Clostridiales bacterium]